MVLEVIWWLNWASSGYKRKQPFDTVLLWRDKGSQEVPPGGWLAHEAHKRVLRAVIWAGWPDRELGWPAFLWGGAVLCVTDAYTNVWLPRALRAALIQWCYHPRNPLPPQPQPPLKQKRRRRRVPRATPPAAEKRGDVQPGVCPPLSPSTR